jgi:hypothetical protein
VVASYRPDVVQWVRPLIWVSGLGALLAALAAWVVHAQPYQAPWAWVSFIAMAILDDIIFGPPDRARWSELPKVSLLAAVIVFRRHPELTVLVASVAAPLGSLVKRQPWTAQVTATAHWVLAAAASAEAFRLVGFSDTDHFVAATIAAMAVYYALGPPVSAFLESAETSTSLATAFVGHRRLFIVLEVAGVLLALAWRTPSLEAAALKLGDLALVGVAGVFVGRILGGTVRSLLVNMTRVPSWLLAGNGVLLLGGQLAPTPLSWILPALAGISVSAWAVRRGLFGVVLASAGMLCNEAVRAVNGGRMLVDVKALPASMQGDYADLGGQSATYAAAGPHTHLNWLADRFPAAPFPGVASIGDTLIAVGAIWLFAVLMARPYRIDKASKSPRRFPKAA